jgi:hypothetical protein
LPDGKTPVQPPEAAGHEDGEVEMKVPATGYSALHAMKGERLRAALRDIGITADDFCTMTGLDPIEVQLWMLGRGDVPRWLPGFLAAISVPEARLRAGAVAKHFLSDEARTGPLN